MDPQVAWQQIPIGIKMACGARDPVGDGDGLIFRVGPTTTLRKMVVRLNGLDLYDVRYCEIKRGDYTVRELGEMTNVDAEQLGEVIYGMVNK